MNLKSRVVKYVPPKEKGKKMLPGVRSSGIKSISKRELISTPKTTSRNVITQEIDCKHNKTKNTLQIENKHLLFDRVSTDAMANTDRNANPPSKLAILVFGFKEAGIKYIIIKLLTITNRHLSAFLNPVNNKKHTKVTVINSPIKEYFAANKLG